MFFVKNREKYSCLYNDFQVKLKVIEDILYINNVRSRTI